MFFWVNISLSYWKLCWINDLKCLFQLFVFNKLHVFWNKIRIIFFRLIFSYIINYYSFLVLKFNSVKFDCHFDLSIHWKIIFNKEIYVRNKHRFNFRYTISKIFIRFFNNQSVWMREERLFNFRNFSLYKYFKLMIYEFLVLKLWSEQNGKKR